MGLRPELLRGVYAFGYETPSIVQQQAIVPASQGHDMIIQAQSGTGKTATFTIAALQQVDVDVRRPQVLVLSPSRELAIGTHAVMASLGRGLKVRCVAIVGGGALTRSEEQRALHRGCHVVSGTVGSVLGMLRSGHLDLGSVRTLVMDEADDLLAERSVRDVQAVFRQLRSDAQTLLVSATFPAEVQQVASEVLHAPIKVLLNAGDVALQGIQQFFVECGRDRRDKTDVLLELYPLGLATKQTMIFVNTTDQAKNLAEDMVAAGHKGVRVFHGGLDRRERAENLNAFREGRAPALVTTDVLARGIDVQQVSAVVNFDLPRDAASYIHRIGRGGRFGRTAIAVNLTTDRDRRQLSGLERQWQCCIGPLPQNFGSLA